MKLTIFLSLLLISMISAGCDDSSQPSDPYKPFDDPIYSEKVDFSGEGRIYYTIKAFGTSDKISSSRWTVPDKEVGENLIEVGEGKIDVETSLLIPEWNSLIAYCSSATPLITFYPAWKGDGSPQTGTYSFKGELVSDDDVVDSVLFEESGDLTVEGTGYSKVEILSEPLPAETARLTNLKITGTYVVDGETYKSVTITPFAQVWRCPIEGTPLYERIIRWGSSWINDTVEDNGEESENQLAETLLMGMHNLEPLGYRYGPFPRPSDFTDRAEVFLDFPQSACGEMRGFYMALTETQGIDSNWLWFWFNHPSSTAYSMYQTREIAALGTNEMVWRYSDHIVVQVNGKVYDPTYLVIADSADDYEDYMFESFCYGEDTACGGASSWCTIPDGPKGICTENHPGYVEGESPPRFTGEDYR